MIWDFGRGGDRGLVALAVFKTVVPPRRRRVGSIPIHLRQKDSWEMQVVGCEL